MCGIAGVVHWESQAGDPATGARLERMLGLLEHRGPDDTGTTHDTRAALGVVRLAIRGGPGGRQPVAHAGTGVVVACNGEIDNHNELRRWLVGRGRAPATGSDVALLPELYLEVGEDLPRMLEGAFALAVWDPRVSRLLLARDRAGERPLYYRQDSGEVVFATELSALATDTLAATGEDPTLDRTALEHYLRWGWFAAPESPLAGLRKLHPAEVALFEPAGRRSRRYWRWSLGERPAAGSGVADLDRVLREAVRRQSVCDVDYGLFVSGGVDSALVAAIARDLEPGRSLRAYTLRFAQPSYDEGDAALRVARFLDLESHEVWVRAEDFPAKLEELVRLTGEPLADPAWVPTTLLAMRAARDVKMVLVGEGGDEVFGGYPTYTGAMLAGGYARLPAPLRRVVTRLVRAWPPSDRKVTLSFLLKRFVEGDGVEPLARHLLWTSTIEPALLERLGIDPRTSPMADRSPGGSPARLLDRLQRHDLENSMAEGLLTKVDRGSMHWSVEPRAPFLDRGVLEFAATLPPSRRARGLGTKVMLKELARRYLPRSIVYRRKRGLSVPLATWLRGPLADWATERLAGGILTQAGVRTPAALALFEEHRGGAQHGRTLWTLLVLAEWLRWWEENRRTSPHTRQLSMTAGS